MSEPGFHSKASIKEQQERVHRQGSLFSRASGKPLFVLLLVLAVLLYFVVAVSGQLGS